MAASIHKLQRTRTRLTLDECLAKLTRASKSGKIKYFAFAALVDGKPPLADTCGDENNHEEMILVLAQLQAKIARRNLKS